MGDMANMAAEQAFMMELDGDIEYESDPSRIVKPGSQCPRAGCTGHYVQRTNSHTGQKFLGCSEWPKCHQTH